LEKGIHDGDLRGDLVKKRLARPGEGKSGGYRAIIAVRLRDRAFFVYGFAKNRIDNLNDAELREYRKLARILLNYTGAEIRRALEAGELKRVDYGNDKI
jgi:hypothetical protein